MSQLENKHRIRFQERMTKGDLKEKSDEDLMELYKLGNSMAFDFLFQRHSGQVLGYLKRRVSKDKDAQDILQDIFLKLHRSKHQYDRSLPFLPWLFSITRSVWLDSLKKKNLEYVTESEVIENMMNASNANPVTFQTDSSGLDLKILNQLPATQKKAVSMRVIDDATFDEIGLKLSTSPENARQLVSRGLKGLRDLLGSKGKEQK